MSDIPYSVRDKNIRVNAIKGFNFADIDTNEMFKKVDENNVGGTDVLSTQTSTTNKLIMNAGADFLKVSVGVLEGITTLLTRSLHINVSGTRERGMTIFDSGGTTRVGIGVTEPEEDLEVDGNIQIDGANNPRLKFQRTGGSPHALSEIRAEQDGTNGGDLQIRTKDDGGVVTEKLRINTDGAIGIIGANYGDAGAVLTSNGGTLPVSWTTPYFFGAHLLGQQIITDNVLTTIAFAPYLLAPYNGNNAHMTSSIWSCPKTGLYKVNIRIIASMLTDDIRSVDVFVISTSGGVDTYQSAGKYFNSTYDDVQATTITTETLIALSHLDTLRGQVRISSSPSTGNRTLEQSGTFGGRATELTITRVI